MFNSGNNIYHGYFLEFVMPRKIRNSKRNRRNSINTDFSPPSITTGTSLSVSQWDELLNAEDTNAGPDNRINFGLGMTAADIEKYEALLDLSLIHI